jgi:signal transduction histidine kinase
MSSGPPTGRIDRSETRGARDLRPLDWLRSIKAKLGVLVAATVTVSALVTWLGVRGSLGPSRTLPLAIIAALIVTQLLAHGMTSPLREMTAATRAMARGDYTRRVRATSRDEVGQLAEAFNSMAEDLASADEQRRELIANVSHELRTPLAALRAQLENMADGVVEPDSEALGSALGQTERLGRLVASLLDLSRLEAGAVGLELVDVDVRAFLDDVVSTAGIAARSAGRNVRWVVTSAPEDLRVRADPERLHQVMSNLLENAARHSPAGGVVRVTAGAEAGGQDVVIDVADEGQGIDPADRERIFERFRLGTGQAPSRRSAPSTGGTGLGLAIARWAVTLHGGTITAQDPDDGGSPGATLRVRLPANGPAPGPGPVGPGAGG